MIRMMIVLAIAVMVVGAVLPGANGSPHSYDLTPVFGGVAVVVFIIWMSKKRGR